MKKLLIILLLIVGCGTEQVREEIIERYPSGEKMMVVKYKGEGNEEKMVERTTYSISGKIELYENFVDNYTHGYAELNNFHKADTLKAYLQGIWKGNKYSHNILFQRYSYIKNETHEIIYNVIYNSPYQMDETTFHDLYDIEYQDSSKVNLLFKDSFTMDDSTKAVMKKENEINEWNIIPLTKNQLILNYEYSDTNSIVQIATDTLYRTTLDSLPIISNKPIGDDLLNDNWNDDAIKQTEDRTYSDSAVFLKLENHNSFNKTLDIYLTNSVPIAGLQFDLPNIEIIDGKGGLLEKNDYQSSNSSSRFLSFSMQAKLIEPTSGLLTTIYYSGTPTRICMDNIIVAGKGGDKVSTNTPKCIDIESDCVEYVALWAAGDIAERLGKDRKWVFLNYTVDLWDAPPAEGEGNTVGKLRASSYARIIEKREDDYKVESPINQVQGWISNEHVKTTSWKNPKTRKLCK